MPEPIHELWWSQIHGPRQLKNEIENVLLTPGRGLWIYGSIPWPETLYRLVKNELSEKDSQICLTYLDANSKEFQQLKPADMISQLNSDALSRCMPGKPLAEFVRDNRILETHILWISNLDIAQHEDWLSLSRELAQLKTGFQIICQGQLSRRKYTNLALLQAKDYSTQFDHILFAMQLAAEFGVSSDMQMYYTYLAVGIADGWAENIPTLMKSPDALTRDPATYTAELGFDQAGLEQILHKVQVKALLPILEERQEHLVDELSDVIKLPFYDEYGRKFQELYEVELRNMHFFYQNKKLPMSPTQVKQLEQLYKLRNMVAHRQIVPGEMVMDFLL